MKRVGIIGYGNIGSRLYNQLCNNPNWFISFITNRKDIFKFSEKPTMPDAENPRDIESERGHHEKIIELSRGVDLVFLCSTRGQEYEAYLYIKNICEQAGIPVVTCETGALGEYFMQLQPHLWNIGYNATTLDISYQTLDDIKIMFDSDNSLNDFLSGGDDNAVSTNIAIHHRYSDIHNVDNITGRMAIIYNACLQPKKFIKASDKNYFKGLTDADKKVIDRMRDDLKYIEIFLKNNPNKQIIPEGAIVVFDFIAHPWRIAGFFTENNETYSSLDCRIGSNCRPKTKSEVIVEIMIKDAERLLKK